MKGRIFNLQRYCVNDGKGIRTTVFLKGCPLYCPWCHNPEGIEFGAQRDINGKVFGKDVEVDDLIKEILLDKVYYDLSDGGVTLSGGEPLVQSDFCISLAKACKQNNVSVYIETCGDIPLTVLEGISPYLDGVLFDIKSLDQDLLSKVTGGRLHNILHNLNYLNDIGLPIVLRSPIIKGFNANAEHYEKLAVLAKNTRNVVGVELLPYHSLGHDKRKALGCQVFEFEELTQQEKDSAISLMQKIYLKTKMI